MKVWLYYRLSRDEDEELNSLNNQRKIIYNFAVSNGHEVVGESFDDNVSGMHFNREGIDKIYEVVEAGKIEAIIVKDLSRLGRHRTQTALFIDYLREHDVRVLSATENIDTFNENDDLIIGFKGLVNDFYVCRGYHRNGKAYCSSHRIREETLDARVWELVSTARESRTEELKKLAQMQKMWALRKPVLDAHILSLREKVQRLEEEVDAVVIEKILLTNKQRT